MPIDLGLSIRRQKVIPPCYSVMKYAVPSLIVFVWIKYRGKPNSLFVENPALVWCFLTGISVYWLIAEQIERMETVKGERFRVLNRIALTSVVVTVVSLVSMFLPPLFVPLMALTPLPVILLVLPILHRGIASFIGRLRAKLASPETSLQYVVLNHAALAAVVVTSVSLSSIFLLFRITFVPLMVLTFLPVLLWVLPILYRAYTWVRLNCKFYR